MKLQWMFATALLAAVLGAPLAMAQTQAPPPPAPPAVLPPSPTATGPSKIAVINIQEAIVATAEGKKLDADLQKRFEPRRTELENEQKALASLNDQLKAGGNTMSQDAKAELQRQITAKQRDFQTDANTAQQDYQNAQTDVLNTVGNKLMPILNSYAQQHGYTVVLDVSLGWPQTPVLYHNAGTDITGDIVRLYDQSHPSSAAASTPSSTTK